MTLAPIVGVAHELHRLVALELDELEWTRADGLGAHQRRRYMAGIDGVVAGGKEGEEGGLRALEMERHLMVAVDRHLLQVVPPNLARVLAEAVRVLVLELVQRAGHVLGRERLAVVPLDVVAQLEAELGLVVVPCPAGCKLRQDSVRSVEPLVLVVEHQVVVDAHERRHRRDGCLLVNRGAGWVVPDVHAQRAALLLGERRTGGEQQRRCKCRGYSLKTLVHAFLPAFRPAANRVLKSCAPVGDGAPQCVTNARFPQHRSCADGVHAAAVGRQFGTRQ